jgi:hypothetical protein
VGIIDALGQGAGGIIVGKLFACTPTIFGWQWLDDIKANITSYNNPTGEITNSDLETAGLLLLWLTMEGVCRPLHKKRVTLFSNNTPTVGWVTNLASKKSTLNEHLIQALALCLKSQLACPLTPMHIEGKRNSIADVPSHFLEVTLCGTAILTQIYSCFSTLCFRYLISSPGQSSI